MVMINMARIHRVNPLLSLGGAVVILKFFAHIMRTNLKKQDHSQSPAHFNYDKIDPSDKASIISLTIFASTLDLIRIFLLNIHLIKSKSN
ncbi:hypothetical protein C1646_367319 [Rhizophagus diaphanus]|nr:hypothetical protein C1646_367319 [Rhizophagus diaphanus] [Rhizophagus sp. MUCL 43196]